MLDQTLDEDAISHEDMEDNGPGRVGSNMISIDKRRDSIRRNNYDPSIVFAEERDGWKGLVTPP